MCKWLLLALLASTCVLAEEGYATYYTEESCKREGTSGVFTANGERFDEQALTCAMRDKRCYDRKHPVYFKVTNLENGKSVVVKLNDFGPGEGPASKGVIIDLTPAAKKAIGMKGKAKVKVEEVKQP
jgi:rare lipoprotein A